MGEERVVLEDEADLAFVDHYIGNVLAVDEYTARRGCLEASHHAQRGRLAAAGGSEEGDEFAALYL